MGERPPDGGEGGRHNQHQHAAAAAEQEAAGASRAGRIWHAEAPSALHASANLRGQSATPPPLPISPLLSRLSLGWSLAGAFTAGALAFYTVRYFMSTGAEPASAPSSSSCPPQVKVSTRRTTSPAETSPTPVALSPAEEQQQKQRLHQRVQQTLDRTTLASRERIKRWLDRVSRRKPTDVVSVTPPVPPYHHQGVFEGSRLKRRLLPPASSSS